MFQHSLRSVVSFGAIVTGVLLVAGSVVPAQETLHRFPTSQLVNGKQMRGAFKEVVTQAHRSTVRFLADGTPIALGTIVREDGQILTKASQITSATIVELADGRQMKFETVEIYRPLDLAIVQVNATGLPVIAWAEKSPEVGGWLVTSGISSEPVAVGVMSAGNRSIPRSDARGYLGIDLERNDLPKIRRILPNSGASEAGLQEGDIVLEVDQRVVNTARELVDTLSDYRPGDTLTVKIRRDEQEIPYQVTLSHPFSELLSRIAFQNQLGGSLSFRRDDFEEVAQHDAVLRPEDCGGPVLNLNGEAAGINIARAGRTETFYIPAEKVLSVLETLRNDPGSSLTVEKTRSRP